MENVNKMCGKFQLAARIMGLTAGLALAMGGNALAVPTDLASSPLQNITTVAVLPNVMFMLDDSGSMNWDYLPDVAQNFAGNYGYNSSQCNGVTYNPNVVYNPPVDSTGTSYANSTFTAAWVDGYNTAAGTVDLSSGFTGGSGSGSSGIGLPAGPAFYYAYTGTQTTAAQKNYFNTGSQFYTECNSGIAPGPGNAVFTQVILASSAPTATITITNPAAGGGATITITGTTSNYRIGGITDVTGNQIMSNRSVYANTNNGVATNIVAQINACYAGATGACSVAGYGATCPGIPAPGPGTCTGNVITITGPAPGGSALSWTTSGTGTSATLALTPFPMPAATSVSFITVSGISILTGGTASTSSNTTLAGYIAANIGAGYTASVLGNVVTITGPVSASNVLPVVTTVPPTTVPPSPPSGGLVVTPGVFSKVTTAFDLQNFANWYSYYSNRMMMMKTSVGRAFAPIGANYRIGFMTMNNNISPDIVDIAPFNAAQKLNWYSKLYGSSPGNSTPLRGALSHVGQLYAHKFGTIDKYTATITVNLAAGGVTAVNSVMVNGTQLFSIDPVTLNPIPTGNWTTTSALATDIANQINSPISTDYGAKAVGNVVTIYGPAWALGFTPVMIDNGTMTETGTAFVKTTTTAQLNGITPADPMQYSCQQNFVILSTDGYWNGSNDALDLNNVAIGNVDGTTSVTQTTPPATWGPEARPLLDATNTANTLADVAEYYYQNDLRDGTLGNCTGALGTDVCTDNVPTTAADPKSQQHMTTFTLGLGARGQMAYSSTYTNLTSTCNPATDGDFCAVLQGASSTGVGGICPWQTSGTVCNWPVPASGGPTNIDDLWHAAVNGRGIYFSATDPSSLDAGLSSALAGVQARLGAASASATSNPNLTRSNNFIFSATYLTQKWDGEVTSQAIDPVTGVVLPAILWSAQAQLDTLVNSDATADKSVNRHIYTFDSLNASGTNLKPFLYGNLTLAEKAYFDNKCVSSATLSQCTAMNLTAGQIITGNLGLNLVDYLRGNQSLETPTQIFRARNHFLGDTVDSRPLYMKFPVYSFTDAGYLGAGGFVATQTALPRQAMLYVGANDGMLHALNADTGSEMWAYVPKMVMPNLYKLADANYAAQHQYYVDGSPETMDVYVASPTNNLTVGWHTILVAGLGFGGQGFYALDITDPANPKALWEICSSSTLCAISDVDMGYSYGNPVIVKRNTDGKWVVLLTSGYNNAGAGKGTLFELDVITGQVLHKTYTDPVATNPPSGLSKINPWIDSSSTNMTARYVYGGDLNGNVWRFDLGSAGVTEVINTPRVVTEIASLKDSAGVAQSITTRPELGDPLNSVLNSLGGAGKPGIFVATGRYLGTTDLANLQIQSVYGIEDNLAAPTYYTNPRTWAGTNGPFVRQYIYQATATTRTTSQNAVDWTVNAGWYADLQAVDASNVPLSPSPTPGERVNIDPMLIGTTLLVGANVPDASACTAGGTSWLYSFNFLTGTNIYSSPTAGQQVSNSSMMAGFSDTVTTTGTNVGQINLTSGQGIQQTLNVVSGMTKRTSWRELTP